MEKQVLKMNEQTKSLHCKNHPEYVKLEDEYSELMYNYSFLLKENDKLRRKIALFHSNTVVGTLNTSDIISTGCEENLNHSVSSQVPDDAHSSAISTTEHSSGIEHDLNMDSAETPYTQLSGHPFSSFSAELLDNETVYSHCLESRKLKYFGVNPYGYGNIMHNPCSVPENSYLNKIIKHVLTVCPQYVFNSVLLTKFENGESFLPMHSDNEEAIQPNSVILTVSLGETRAIEFQSKCQEPSMKCTVNVMHGDVYTMTYASQREYKHGIPKDSSKDFRLSLTFRNIVPKSITGNGASINGCCSDDVNPGTSNVNVSLDSIGQFLCDLGQNGETYPNTSPPLPVISECNSNKLKSVTNASIQPKVSYDNIDTIFISSSMFREISEAKLSTSQHNSCVFYYPGATASGILHRMQRDAKMENVDRKKIKQVFLLCGTNDVDNILGVKRLDHDNINITVNRYSQDKLKSSLNDIEKLILHLHNKFESANLKIINILPRASKIRNGVINDINSFLKNLCYSRSYTTYINTEYNFNLFSDPSGHRKSDFFKSIGSDNVHLSRWGVTRLGKHLKYLVHN